MTAAALKPNLFNHLLASRPEGPDRSSLAASLMSLVLHALVVLLAIWASVSLERTIAPPTDEMIQPIVIATPSAQPPAQSAGARGSAAPGSAAPRLEAPAPVLNDPGSFSRVVAPHTWQTDVPPTDGAPGQGGGTPGSRSSDVPGQGFAVLQVLPDLLNRAEVQRALQKNYPSMLRDAGIGGTAIVWLLLSEDGNVLRAEIKESSGQRTLDEAALNVAPLMRFSPARNRDQRVKVWVAVPLRFTTQ